jgi:exodeoxyribonuclease V gamma subunit
VRALHEGGAIPDLSVATHLEDGTLLTGEVGGRWKQGSVRHQFSRVSGKQLVRLWIQHLASCWCDERKPPSFVVGRAPAGHRKDTIAYRLRPVAEPEPMLRGLVGIYLRGLTEPLPFFPKAGLAFVKALGEGKSENDALKRASSTFKGEELARDAHLRRVFGDDTVIYGRRADTSFAALSRAVLGPLVEHLEELS